MLNVGRLFGEQTKTERNLHFNSIFFVFPPHAECINNRSWNSRSSLASPKPFRVRRVLFSWGESFWVWFYVSSIIRLLASPENPKFSRSQTSFTAKHDRRLSTRRAGVTLASPQQIVSSRVTRFVPPR
jgi:hypothetical protein